MGSGRFDAPGGTSAGFLDVVLVNAFGGFPNLLDLSEFLLVRQGEWHGCAGLRCAPPHLVAIRKQFANCLGVMARRLLGFLQEPPDERGALNRYAARAAELIHDCFAAVCQELVQLIDQLLGFMLDVQIELVLPQEGFHPEGAQPLYWNVVGANPEFWRETENRAQVFEVPDEFAPA